MHELSSAFSLVAEKDVQMLQVSLGPDSDVWCPALALVRRVRKTETRGGFIQLKTHNFEQRTT